MIEEEITVHNTDDGFHDQSMDSMLAEIAWYEKKLKEGYFDDVIKIQEMRILTLHFKPNPTNHKPYHIYTIPDFNMGLVRNLKHRGIPYYPLAARLMTEQEKQCMDNGYRVVFEKWRTWEELITYEMKQIDDKNWIEILDQCSKLCPITKTTAVGKNGQIKMII